MLHHIRFPFWYAFYYIKYNALFSHLTRKLELFPYEKYFESSRWRGFRVYVRTLCLIFINGHMTIYLKGASPEKMLSFLRAIRFKNEGLLDVAKQRERLILTCPHTGPFFCVYAHLLINKFFDREVIFLHDGLTDTLDMLGDHPLAKGLNFSHVHVKDRRALIELFRSKKTNVVICMLYDMGEGYGETQDFPFGKTTFGLSVSLAKMSKLFDANVLLFSAHIHITGISARFVSLHAPFKGDGTEYDYMRPFYDELSERLDQDPAQWDRWQNIDKVLN